MLCCHAGEGSFRDGGDGKDLYIRVPVGTIIRKKDAQVTSSSSSSSSTTAKERLHAVLQHRAVQSCAEMQQWLKLHAGSDKSCSNTPQQQSGCRV
jgi:GTPase involved in cell partitioning and DNA repair